jgi:hypothetical protein
VLRRDGAVSVEERRVPGPSGAPDISLLILRLAGNPGPVPGIYHIHGGGMVLGDNRTGLAGLAECVTDLGAAVVSVEYRLAPEHPHPAPVEDCYTGLVWAAEHAEELGVDPSRLLVYGGSSGGGLAAGTALLARDRGGPHLTHQILLCPMLDDRGITPSSQELDGEGVWDRNANLVGWTALLGHAWGGPDVSPYAAPARATNLSGCRPPTSTSGPWRRSGTRRSTTPRGWPAPGSPSSCTCGPARPTGSRVSRRGRPSARTPAPPAGGTCVARCASDRTGGWPRLGWESTRSRPWWIFRPLPAMVAWTRCGVTLVRLSIRNQFAGTVAAVAVGEAMSTVKVRLAGGQEVTAAITAETVPRTSTLPKVYGRRRW